jgi:hypothetical protein
MNIRNDSIAAQVRISSLRELDALVGKYLTGDQPKTFWEDSHSYLRFESLEEALDTLGDPYFQRCFPDGVRLDNELSEVFEFRAYSSDMTLAWEVVERLTGVDHPMVVRREKGKWVASFGDGPSARARSAPVAICLAALQARGIDVDFVPERARPSRIGA